MRPRSAVGTSRGALAALVAAVLAGGAFGLYEEQVGQFEWAKRGVGAPREAVFLKKSVIVGTDKGVLANLGLRNGEINWRHILGSGDVVTALDATEDHVATVSTDGLLRVWASVKGVLLWETVVAARGSAARTSVEFFGAGLILVVANGTATTVSTSGAVAWTRSAPAGGALAAAAATADVCIAFARTDDVLVSCVAPTTGVELWSRSVPGAATSLAAFRDGVGVVLVSAAAGRHVIVASFARTGSVSSQEHAVADLGHTAEEPFWVERATGAGGVTAWLVSAKSRILLSLSVATRAATVAADGTAAVASRTAGYKVTSSALSPSSCPAIVLLGGAVSLVTASLEDSGISVAVDGTLASAAAEDAVDPAAAAPSVGVSRGENGGIVRCFAVGSSATARTKFVRVLVVATDATVALVQGSRLLWSRPEWLASITRVVALSPNLDDAAADSAEEPTLRQRLAMQWAALSHTAAAAQAVIASALGVHVAANPNTAYRFDKIWVVYSAVASGVGKVAGIDAETGAVTWSRLLSISNTHTNDYEESALRLFVTRAHSIGGRHSEVAIAGAVAAGGAGVVHHFDATSGRPAGIWHGTGRFIAAVLLPVRGHSAHAVGILSVVDSGRAMDVVPEVLADAVIALGDTFVVSLFDSSSGELVGYQTSGRISGGRLSLRPAWVVQTAVDGFEVAAVVRKDRDDPIDSPVTIRGDDSLLVKYVNPHLLAVVSVARGCATADDSVDTLAVTVIDTVSGRVRARVRHRTACGPSYAVLADNWVVYSYWNAKARRAELGSLALYEGTLGPKDLLPFSDLPPALDTFSSFNDDATLVTYHKTFVLPASVSCLGVTRTRLGITSRNVLAALDSFSILSLDRRFLDPRRPSDAPTEPEKLEGLVPYNAFLPMFHQAVLSHGSEVAHTTLLSSAPAVLESTTFVLASGLDVYFTRAMPSKSFDILDAEFNRGLLLALTGTLFVATIVLSRMAAKAQLAMQWK